MPAPLLSGADIVLSVRAPDAGQIAEMKKGAVLAALLAPYTDKDTPAKLAAQGVDAFAMEFLPRISRAQAMDVLSTQANLAGYKAVIDAAAQFGRAMPMMMTAAGTIAPARVLVMGVGVAGLQAIATARRLGRHRVGDRRAPRDQGTGGIAGRHLRRGDGRRVQEGPDRRPAMPSRCRRNIRPSRRR